MEHHAPHSNAAFEGYYNKFDLPSGAHLIMIICKVKDAKSKPNTISFTYVPKDASKIFQRELFPERIDMRRTGEGSNAFILEVPGIGYAKWNDDSSTEYEVEHETFSFRAHTTSRAPWSAESNTPEGPLVHLPLPLHWHVQSLASQCKFNMKIRDEEVPPDDLSGQATLHQEKNWAFSFPPAHIWVQCRDGERGFCCAGGQILGMEAFLLGYRSNDLNFDFRPPFASFRRKITVKAVAPKGTFFSLAPPFQDGHRENFLGQSFQADVKIKIYESGWVSQWNLVREDHFEGASLEFAGGYYPPAGSEQRIN
ncbi:hypothetical protein LTR37_020166 [Vermiconidia calcicola]|uniref:Uncharacterized protein n=1 Tax=Vermiconidia calcicola TaxID=1690605 RepID=A0ACC3MCB0_9PEZI|nr:hypothetical protein LTR37_020166 [Vermiconidia calcicola]